MRHIALFSLALTVSAAASAHDVPGGASVDPIAAYQKFRHDAINRYNAFHDSVNARYAEHLLTAWAWYEGKAPMPAPQEKLPVAPVRYDRSRRAPVRETSPEEVVTVPDEPRPMPAEPVKEIPEVDAVPLKVKFFGHECSVRLPMAAKQGLPELTPQAVSRRWTELSEDGMNNAIRDCLETRMRYNLCDWAYLRLLDTVARAAAPDSDAATLLMAYLYCRSGYQMRLGVDDGHLTMLYGSLYQIYDTRYYELDGAKFYQYGQASRKLNICNIPYESEAPMSLAIAKEQLLGNAVSMPREIVSEEPQGVKATVSTPLSLLEFFDSYPVSTLGNDPLTKWAVYAGSPMSASVRETLYPSLRRAIDGCTQVQAADRLLKWIQYGFEYEYDDKVWGHDRAFFAEETLYYPYCDCEDRAILFTRLVRDLLGLDAALVYCPGHLAAAVRFTDDEMPDADCMNVDGRRYVICDPTYIGAPVGVRMPDLDYDAARMIILDK
ncbi:MAG: hypothetical protein NC187_02600 [Candidatus Amulumruptor caecigallinarius]|nr:hypothetical protein [Candidatus Amulumruptor caecigallinarius]MCM1396366.1 hypothetical protein [Candidatus Amulumruptor caecigallinarius]MCM1453692.1 hypothetical protein [bacterium]